MNTPIEAQPAPVFEPDPEATYSLDVVAEITGVSTQTILHYREQGLLPASDPNPAQFDDEALRVIRRIDHLQTHFEMNAEALKLVISLMNEVERLQGDLRARR
jgi:DNA-binding transcriptional MerR regulator